MTPTRLIELVDRALGRPGTTLEYTDWAQLLAPYDDDTCDQAYLAHKRTSPHPATASDVVKHAIAIGNDRAMRAATDRRRIEIETGIAQEGDHAGQPLKPMPPEVRDGLRDLIGRRHVPDVPDLDDDERMAQARAELDRLRTADSSGS